ncbi:MAG: S-layer homology domain-containing protein [Eubacteriales bacterium]|nr:S-layer homology domain-containing protein [Eubacteriales bacterium]
MKRFKKLTAGLLGVVMALGVCSFTAFAEDGVAEIKGKNVKYETLQAAINAATNGDTIVLLDDVTEDITIAEGKNIVLDLGDYKITNSSDHTITNKGTLRIKGSGTVDNVTHAKAAVFNDGTIILDGGNYTRSQEAGKYDPYGNGGNSYYAMVNYGNMTINYAKVEANGGFSSLIRNGGMDESDEYCILVINDGVFSGGVNTVKNDSYGKLYIEDGEFKNVSQSTLQNWNVTVINGGTFKSDAPYSILAGSIEGYDFLVGEITINGGTFRSNDYTIYQFNGDYTAKSIVINGGTFESKRKDGEVFDIKFKTNDTDINITNGSFSSDVSEYMAEGSKLVEDKDGNYVVMDEEKYEGYLDSKRPSHSYSLEEGRVERDDEDEEEPVVTTPAEEEESPYEDVGKDNPYYNAIVYVTEKGWMSGISTDSKVFAPNGTLTRGMGVMVLWNKAGCPEPQNVAPFLDVTSDAWYAKAVAWAYEQGIVAGYGDVFGPDDALTTEQFERMSAIANGKTPEIYVGGAPNATRGWVASLLAM